MQEESMHPYSKVHEDIFLEKKRVSTPRPKCYLGTLSFFLPTSLHDVSALIGKWPSSKMWHKKVMHNGSWILLLWCTTYLHDVHLKFKWHACVVHYVYAVYWSTYSEEGAWWLFGAAPWNKEWWLIAQVTCTSSFINNCDQIKSHNR